MTEKSSYTSPCILMMSHRGASERYVYIFPLKWAILTLGASTLRQSLNSTIWDHVIAPNAKMAHSERKTIKCHFGFSMHIQTRGLSLPPPILATSTFERSRYDRQKMLKPGPFVTLPCIIRKWGLLIFRPTDWKKSATLLFWTITPLIKYLFFPPMLICLVTTISSYVLYPIGEFSKK